MATGDVTFQYLLGTGIWTSDIQAGRAATAVYTYTAGSPNIRSFALADRVVLDPSSDGLLFGSTSAKLLGFYGATPATQPNSANQTAVTDSTGGSVSDAILAVVPNGGGSFYASTLGSAQSANGTPAVFGNGMATTAIEVSKFTHASPGRLTYTGTPTTGFHVLATGSVRIGSASEVITFNIHKNGVVVNAGFACNIEAAGVNDVLDFVVQCDVSLATNNYLELYVNTDGTSVNLTPLSFVMHVTASEINEGTVIADNFAKLAELTNSLRSALVTLGLIKGSA